MIDKNLVTNLRQGQQHDKKMSALEVDSLMEKAANRIEQLEKLVTYKEEPKWLMPVVEAYLDHFNWATVRELIESHQYLRKLNLEKQETFSKAIEDGKNFGRADGFKEVTQSNYIKVDKLKSMTLVEIVKFLEENNEI